MTSPKPQQSQVQEVAIESMSTMDKMKKLLSSPITRKKNLPNPTPNPNRYFGIHLDELARRENELNQVPLLVQKICIYIQNHGMEQEGLFRISGSKSVMEKLKSSFDKTGNADFEEAGDVMAIAGLLKMFLRELPDSVIPDNLTRQFINVQDAFVKDTKECNRQLRVLLNSLPKVNYSILRYLCRFLIKISLHQDQNKMNSVALGIVFGPNLFSSAQADTGRCSSGIEGLRDQGVTNEIVNKFIKHYDDIFLQEGEVSPYSSELRLDDTKGATPSRNPPARPPPPQWGNSYSPRSSSPQGQQPPVPSPRKTKAKYDSAAYEESLEHHAHHKNAANHYSSYSPHLSDDELLDTHRSSSPFLLDGDDRSSIMASPVVNTSINDVVEQAITQSVSEYLFGDTETHTTEDHMNEASVPVPSPRRGRKENGGITTNEQLTQPGDSSHAEAAMSVKDRVRLFSESTTSNSREPEEVGAPKRQRPVSQAFEMFEAQGIIIEPHKGFSKQAGSVNGQRGGVGAHTEQYEDEGRPQSPPRSPPSSPPVPKPRSPRKKIHTDSPPETQTSTGTADLEFGNLATESDPLTSFKRAPGPKNRRTPTRRSLKDSAKELDTAGQNGQGEPPGTSHVTTDIHPKHHKHKAQGDENHNEAKPRIGFLNLHHNGQWEDSSPPVSEEQSPTGTRKPFVPPLDLSILHEHGDGSDPILAEKGPSLSFHKAKSLQSEEVLLSPRTQKLKKKSNMEEEGPLSPSASYVIGPYSAHPDYDVPPSPPNEQPVYHKSVTRQEDIQANNIRQLMKRIQSYKKKIKQFEEDFEEDHGYRPSQTDKSARPDIKKYMTELAKARKELKRMKEELHLMRDVDSDASPDAQPHTSSWSQQSSDGRVSDAGLTGGHLSDSRVTMGDTLSSLLQRLEEKRADARRPEDLMHMGRQEIQDEKLAVQKSLLQFESIHGRPVTREEKELMRPLYDRYRNIKRLLAKPLSPREKATELQSVPEDSAIEFETTSAKSSNQDTIRIPTAAAEEDTENRQQLDFSVTRDFSLLKTTIRPSGSPESLQTLRSISSDNENLFQISESALHELPVSQLYDEQIRAKNEKKRLRKVLREFEDDFFRQSGRKVQKEDRAPMESEYSAYKQIKARLKLLEALLAKHDPTSSI